MAVCGSVLQCVAVCCSVLQCVAVCCNVLQCVAACCSVLQCAASVAFVVGTVPLDRVRSTSLRISRLLKIAGLFCRISSLL